MTTHIKTIADLQPDLQNANKGSVRGAGMLEKSLRAYGAGRSILVDRDGSVIAGNKTLESAAAIGLDDVIVVQSDGTKLVVVQRTDLDINDPKARELAIADNRVGQVSLEWDAAVLSELMADGVDMTVFWREDELAALLGGTEALTGLLEDADPDAIPEDVETRCKPGDLWQMGRHRLLCGDSTNPLDLDILMQERKASFVFSDPPYGYEYQSNMRTKSPKFDVITNDDTILSDYIPLLDAYSAGWVIVCTSWKVVTKWIESCSPLGTLQNIIVWDKGGGGMGDLVHSLSTDYELLLAYNRGAPICGKRIGSVWSIGKDAAGTYQHATQKPVNLVTMAYEVFTMPDALVLDPFLGSGTTIIAAESTGRTCYGLELEPKYCDIILARWEAATGKTAERITDARS